MTQGRQTVQDYLPWLHLARELLTCILTSPDFVITAWHVGSTKIVLKAVNKKWNETNQSWFIMVDTTTYMYVKVQENKNVCTNQYSVMCITVVNSLSKGIYIPDVNFVLSWMATSVYIWHILANIHNSVWGKGVRTLSGFSNMSSLLLVQNQRITWLSDLPLLIIYNSEIFT